MGFEHRTDSRQPPLITPSASPPSRSQSFSYNPHANIITSGKSSSSSGSSIRTGSRFSSTPLSITETPDIPTLRSQSTSRLLSVWSTLADRYSLRVDQDDIVDIRTGQLVKDRGVVRGLNGKWDFGRFASVEDDAGDEHLEYEEDTNRGTEGVQEESDDELDSFAYLDHQQGLDGPQEDIEAPANPFMTLSNLTSRATHAIDPTNDEDDAADLRAFLEDERHRKETQGDAAEQDDISTGESRIEEGGSEFVTEIDTETEAGFTTEGEPFSDYDEVPTLATEKVDKVQRSPILRGKEGSEDELELWDASDFDIILSSEKANEIPSSSKSKSHPHLITPPNSSTYSESHTDLFEPLVSSPPLLSPIYSSTRSKSRQRSSTDHPPTTITKPFTPASSTSLPSSSPFIDSSRIPRLDLSRLSNLRRGRSQSRSPSKVSQRKNEDTGAAASVTGSKNPSRSKTANPELPPSYSTSSSSRMSKRHSSEAIGTSSSPQNAGKSVRHKGKAQNGAGELDKNFHVGKIEPKPTAVDIKGKSKAREIIEIDSSSDELPLDSITSSSRRLLAKDRGKKRARSSGASWSSEAQWENDSHQAAGGSTTIHHRKSKLMGSPTKKGRYTVLSDSEPEEVIHHTSAHSSCEIDPISSPAKLSPRRAPQNTHPEQRRRNKSSQSRSRQSRLASNVQIYEDKDDDHQKNEHSPHGSFHRSAGRSRSRARANSKRAVAGSLSGAGLGRAAGLHDYPMRDPSPSRYVTTKCDDTGQSDIMLSPTRAASQSQIQKAFEGRAKDIISNAIKGLYSLLTPEGMTALQEQVQDEGSRPSSHQRRISHPSTGHEMVYTPRRTSSRRHPPSEVSITSSPGSSSNKAGTSFLYATPSSHQGRSHRQSHPDPTYSRGTLPPSSPYPELEEDRDYDYFEESDPQDFESDDQPLPTSSPLKTISSSRRERSGPLNLRYFPNSRPRASSIVQRSRSRGRRVSFKEIASETQTKAGETRRTLSREISVEDPVQEIHREGKRVEVDAMTLHREDEAGSDDSNGSDATRPRLAVQSRMRSVGTPGPPTYRGKRQQFRQRSPSILRAPTKSEPPELFETEPLPIRVRPNKGKAVGRRPSRN
ncbi:hypothetical protein C8R41DRAFT_842559 [Lentinula lateritia]|uniref:Uncharacterized protein n=1 Tax=Lentinula lateritia TaxID=40482 RepID=A0ABQ8V8I1_9AGAR|nr:hypothetical protein C8R41DRAFT_842559 [Lentinula lateritia]